MICCYGARAVLTFLNVMTVDDEKWMKEALEEANKAAAMGEVPIGAVVVNGNRIIGRGHNMVETLSDATAHAEMLALSAAEQIAGKYMPDATLYVTVEPCLMCAGAIGWCQVGRIVFGTADIKRGYATYMPAGKSPFHPKSVVVGGVMEEECRDMMQEFFRKKRL